MSSLRTFTVSLMTTAFMFAVPAGPALAQIPPSSTTSADVIPGPTLDRLHAPLLSKEFKINGAVSCSAAGCHGGPRPGVAQPTARRGSEFQIWKERDPHARSWATISRPESVAIMQRLGIMHGDQIVDQPGFDNCLACHNSTLRFNEPRSFVEHREGVGCASCHGPDERWARTHFQHHVSPQFSAVDGFVDGSDLFVRARVCASCHVGDKDRDMNHDIIAAGHPPLKYEFATYHGRLPKHWRDAESKDQTYYEAQLWLAGQVAATDAGLSLLNARSSASHTVSQWPEFAAYDCASCHHSLGLRTADRNLGRPQYSSWNDAGLRWLIDSRKNQGEATREDWALLDALTNVEHLMESAAIPERNEITWATQSAREALAAWYSVVIESTERATFRSTRLGLVVAGAAGRKETFASWESSVQFYLATIAARASWPGGPDGPMRDWADALRNGLRYPQNLDINRHSSVAGQPTISSAEAMSLGIHLAGALGPVEFRPLEQEAEDDDAELRNQLREMIQQINQRWDKMRTEAKPGEQQPDLPTPRPLRKPKTPEELLEELRQRNRNQDAQ